MLTRRDDIPGGYQGLTLDLRVPHSGTLGDLYVLNFSKRLDISPVLRDAIVVARGLYRERWFLEAVAAAVGGEFRETSDSFIIDPSPRHWRSMWIEAVNRDLAIAPSPAHEEFLIIRREAYRALSDTELRRAFQARPADPDSLMGRVQMRVAWDAPLGRRISRYLEHLGSDVFPQNMRDRFIGYLGFVDLDAPIQVHYGTGGLSVGFSMRGSPTGFAGLISP